MFLLINLQTLHQSLDVPSFQTAAHSDDDLNSAVIHLINLP